MMNINFETLVRELRDRGPRPRVRIFVAAAGAGAGIQQTLWNPDGASAYLAGSVFPYSKSESVAFLGFEPPSFVCLDEAIDLAISSYVRADNGNPEVQPIGLGLTAAVATTEQHRGDHRVHAVVITRDRVLASEMTLPKEGAHVRRRDGQVADTLGLELILSAARVIPEPVREAYLEATDGQCLKDITERARNHFLSRPLFTRYGQRLEAPAGNLTLFPGNFDPPHEGHFANAGEEATFQITANPPHKPGLSLTDMLGRVRHFRHKRDVLFMEGGALYLEKARRFPNSAIILGSDALERMLDPRWGVEVLPLLTEFRELGTRFKVGCREGADFWTLPIPADFRDMFTELPKTPYAGLSSTQIREGVLAPTSHAPPGTGQVCGAANDCTRFKGHTGQHANLYNQRVW